MKRGEISKRVLKRYNPRVIELAQDHGGMQALAKKLGIPYVTFARWARGERLPDFDRPPNKALGKAYAKANRKLAKLTGYFLPEVFTPARPIPEMIELSQAPEPISESPEDLLNARIDLARMLATLPADDRAILIEAAQGKTPVEIARDRGCTRQAIEQRLPKIRAMAWRRLKNGARGVAS